MEGARGGPMEETRNEWGIDFWVIRDMFSKRVVFRGFGEQGKRENGEVH